MTKLEREITEWANSVEGADRIIEMYERDFMSLQECIDAIRKQEIKNYEKQNHCSVKEEPDRYLLIFTDGYDLKTRYFKTLKDAQDEMQIEYDARKPDVFIETYGDLSYIDERNATLYDNGNDVYLWQITYIGQD